MTIVQSPITHDVIEKRYIYRYSWTSTLLMLIAGGLGTIGMVAAAATKSLTWPWLFAAVFFLMFLFGAWIAVINVRDKLRFMISKNGVYIPIVWNSDRYTFVSFSRVTAVEFFDTQGNLILQLCVEDKKYPIVHSWFPTPGDFQEIFRVIGERLPAHLTRSPE